MAFTSPGRASHSSPIWVVRRIRWRRVGPGHRGELFLRRLPHRVGARPPMRRRLRGVR